MQTHVKQFIGALNMLMRRRRLFESSEPWEEVSEHTCWFIHVTSTGCMCKDRSRISEWWSSSSQPVVFLLSYLWSSCGRHSGTCQTRLTWGDNNRLLLSGCEHTAPHTCRWREKVPLIVEFFMLWEIGSPVMSLPRCWWVYFCIAVSWIHNHHYIYLLIVV